MPVVMQNLGGIRQTNGDAPGVYTRSLGLSRFIAVFNAMTVTSLLLRILIREAHHRTRERRIQVAAAFAK